jgi:hypothetical protein
MPRLAKMATEVPNTDLGLRIYYERINCLIVLAHIAKRTDPASFQLTEPPSNAERASASLRAGPRRLRVFRPR